MLTHFRFITAGESHGQCMIAVVDGVPAGLPLTHEDIDAELQRRQLGYGRGERMMIEHDKVEILSGVRHGKTLGSPIAMRVANRDYANWQYIMQVEPLSETLQGQLDDEALRRFFIPRPGHADLAGAIKYAHMDDLRNVLERASARETVARVAVGAIAKKFCAQIGITIFSHVVAIGDVSASACETLTINELHERAEASDLRCADPNAEAYMKQAIDMARERGDTLGGIVEIIADNVPIGLGSYVHWDKRLDGRLAQALMSIPAIKGVEIGRGFEIARRRGSEVHDEFAGVEPNAPNARCFPRKTNNAGGLEGGITNGEPIIARIAMKPISTLRQPLQSLNLLTKQPTLAHAERSDVCAVPAAGVVAEAMVAIVLADALLEKFGGDSMCEFKRNFEQYCQWIQSIARAH